MKERANMKKKKATAANGTAAISKREFAQAINAASGKGTGNRALWGELIEVLPQLGKPNAEGDASGQKTTVRKCALERAQRFLGGKFSKRELNAIGVEAVYKLMLPFYIELKRANEVYDFFEHFSAWEYPDLRAVLEARKSHGGVKVCGEGVDVAVKLWELEDSLPLARDNAEREATQRKIDEYKTRLRNLHEEIYETLKRGERRAAQAGPVALAQFNATKDAALKLGAPDMKQIQRERAAQWLIAEREAGHKNEDGNDMTTTDAARQFVYEITDEKSKGGYKNTNALLTALNRYADKLGIDRFIKHRKGGRTNGNE